MQPAVQPIFQDPTAQPPPQFNQQMQPKLRLTPIIPTKNNEDGNPVTDKSKRKCRDLFCLIIFASFWGFMIFVIVFYKLWLNTQNAKLIFEPHDFMRRRCGYSSEFQKDQLAADYSLILNSSNQFRAFCQITKIVYGAEMTTNADPLLSTDCSSFSSTGAAAISSAREYFAKMGRYGRDMTTVKAGVSFSGVTVCVPEALLAATPSSNYCNPPAEAVYLCSHETDRYLAALGKPANNKQYLTQAEYDGSVGTVTSEYGFIQQLCQKLPAFVAVNGLRSDFSQTIIGKALTIPACSKLFVNLNSTYVTQNISQYFADFSANFLTEITQYWTIILAGIGAGLAVMIIYLILIRFIIGVLIWTTVAAVIVCSAGGAIYFFLEMRKLQASNEYRYQYFGYYDASVEQTIKVNMAIGIVLAVISGIAALLTLIFFKTIRIAIAVFKQSMVCIGKIPIIFVFPIFTVIFVCAHLVWSVPFTYLMYLTGTYDATINAFSFEKVGRDASWLVVRVWDYVGSTYFVLMVYGCIWGVFFFYNLLEYNVSAMVVQWYFNRERTRKSMKGSVLMAVKFGCLSLGTIAVTSFITSLVVLIRVIFEYILKRMERGNKAMNSKVVKAAIWFTRCCLKCLQKIVQWFNRNIQIYAAISGEGYCKSMRCAVKLLMAKLLSNGLQKGLSSFFLFIGKVLVTVAAVLVSGVVAYKTNNQLMLGPPIAAGVITFLLSYYVIEIVKLVIDTIFFCFLYEDTYMLREREAGAKPFAPSDLAKLLE